MKALLVAAVLFGSVSAQAASYLCVDGLSAQYKITINEINSEVKVEARGENQGSTIEVIGKAERTNPVVETVRFKENGTLFEVSIGADGVSTISYELDHEQRIREISCSAE